MRALFLLPLLFACTAGSTDDDGKDPKDKNPQEGEVTLTLVAPESGAEYAAGEAVPLHVEAKRNGNAVTIESATWTIGAWSGRGKETEATGLPSGPYTVEVDVVVDGDHYTASADITVAEPVVSNFSYSGTLEADVVLSTDDFGDFEDHCSAPITFTLDAGTIVGSGQCMVFEDFVDDPLTFTMEGTVAGGNITGNLVMAADGDEARTPFTGSGNAGEPLSATFDNTFRDGGNSIRISGNWSARPQ